MMRAAMISRSRAWPSTPLPRDYDMWLRVRERGKLRAEMERAAVVAEIQITPTEFGAYCKQLARRDFSIAALDGCAREKALARGRTFRPMATAGSR